MKVKSIIINHDNLTDNDVKDTVTRVKCFVENGDGEIVLGSTPAGCIQLPGGHVEGGEKLEKAIVREIEEEAGITLDEKEVFAFFEIKNYVKNYRGYGYNRIARMVYFYAKTDQKIDLSKTCFTEEEKTLGLSHEFVPVEDAERLLRKNIKENKIEIYKIISEETLCALEEYKKYKKSIK